MSTETTTSRPFAISLSGIRAKDIACFLGKLGGGCLTLIAVAYFWALIKDHTPEIDGWFFAIPPMASVLSLAFYLAITTAPALGIKPSAGTCKAARIICIVGPWICLCPIIGYFVYELLFRGAGNESLALMTLLPTIAVAIIITCKWAKSKPYLAGNMLLLLGVFCMIVAGMAILAIGIVLVLAMIPILLLFFVFVIIPAIFRAM